MKSTIETVSGKYIDVLDPSPETIDINDIAWHLSRLARFCGATIPLVPYSVAQHSVFVATMVMQRFDLSSNRALIKAALLHDAAEYVLSDIPSPVKHLPGVKEAIDKVENTLLDAIYSRFNLTVPDSYIKIIHTYDLHARAIEAYNFMSSRGKNWPGLPEVSLLELQEFEQPWSSVKAYNEFLILWNELNGEEK